MSQEQTKSPEIISREFRSNKLLEPLKQHKKEEAFTIAQWNMLADQLALEFPRCSQCRLIKLKKVQLFYRIPQMDKEEIIIQVVTQTSQCRQFDWIINYLLLDIICLQQVDHPEQIHQIIGKEQFTILYKQKNGWHADGVSIILRNSRFKLIEHIAEQYKSEGCNKQNYIIAYAQDLLTSDFLIVCVTHLKSKSPYRATRQKQAQQLVNAIKQFSLKKSQDAITVICQDMNDIPDSSVYKVFQESGYHSFYKQAMMQNKREPPVTTYKFRKVEGPPQIRTIDYIWIKRQSDSKKNKLTLLQYYTLPTQQQMGGDGLPSVNYPSDHLLLAGRIIIHRQQACAKKIQISGKL